MRRRSGPATANEALVRFRKFEAELAEVVVRRPGLWLARDTLRVVRLYIAEAVPWEPADRLEEIRVRYLESRLATLRELLVVAEAERVLTRLDPEVDR